MNTLQLLYLIESSHI